MGSTPEITNLVRGRYDTLDGLLAAGELTRGLVEHPGWRHLQGVVDELVARIDRDLDGEREPLSRAQYAQRHGRRAGLRAVEEAAQTLVRVAEDELEKQRHSHEGAGETALREVT
jgi:hypothetical protein